MTHFQKIMLYYMNMMVDLLMLIIAIITQDLSDSLMHKTNNILANTNNTQDKIAALLVLWTHEE